MDEHDRVWTAVALVLREQVSDAVWLSTFQDVNALPSSSATELRISAPNSHVRDRILSRYLPMVRDALEEIGSSGCQFFVEVQAPEPMTPRVRRRPCATTAASRGSVAASSGSTMIPQRRQRGAGDQPAVHVRRVRQGHVQPVRPGCGAARRRDARPLVQPAVHLRLGRPGQDPPAARHRPLRRRPLPARHRPLREHRDVPQRVRRRHPHQLDGQLQAPLPRHRRAADRRHPVHGGQGGAPGGVLPHVQLPARGEQADRHLQRPAPRRHPDARGAAARPLQVGPDHRRPAAGPGDPPGDPAQQVRARRHPRAGRGAGVHRQPHHQQHPRARGRADPGHRLRQPERRPDHHATWPRTSSPT